MKEVKSDDVANKCVVTGKVSNAFARLSHFLHSYKPLFIVEGFGYTFMMQVRHSHEVERNCTVAVENQRMD